MIILSCFLKINIFPSLYVHDKQKLTRKTALKSSCTWPFFLDSWDGGRQPTETRTLHLAAALQRHSWSTLPHHPGRPCSKPRLPIRGRELFKLHLVKLVLVKSCDSAPPHYLLVLRLAVGLVQYRSSSEMVSMSRISFAIIITH